MSWRRRLAAFAAPRCRYRRGLPTVAIAVLLLTCLVYEVVDKLLVPKWNDSYQVTPEAIVRYRQISAEIPPNVTFVNINADRVKQFVFVTGNSANHFQESIDMVASIQRHAPNHTILYYDVGLYYYQAEQLKTWCGVQYRLFDFTKYPSHVRSLKKYAFKTLIIREVALEFGALVWFDASIRLLKPLPPQLFQSVLESRGILLFEPGGHSNYAVTHPAVYAFICTDVERQRAVHQYGSGVIVYHNTEALFKRLLQPWTACSLEPSCIAPVGAKLRCEWEKQHDSKAERYRDRTSNYFALATIITFC